MTCPECGKLCVKKYNPYVLTSNPPIYVYVWWCGCGWISDNMWERGKTLEEFMINKWKEINNIEDCEERER